MKQIYISPVMTKEGFQKMISGMHPLDEYQVSLTSNSSHPGAAWILETIDKPKEKK